MPFGPIVRSSNPNSTICTPQYIVWSFEFGTFVFVIVAHVGQTVRNAYSRKLYFFHNSYTVDCRAYVGNVFACFFGHRMIWRMNVIYKKRLNRIFIILFGTKYINKIFLIYFIISAKYLFLNIQKKIAVDYYTLLWLLYFISLILVYLSIYKRNKINAS